MQRIRSTDAPRTAKCRLQQRAKTSSRAVLYCNVFCARNAPASPETSNKPKSLKKMVKKKRTLQISPDQRQPTIRVPGARRQQARGSPFFNDDPRQQDLRAAVARIPPQAESNAGVCRGGREVGPGLLSPAGSRRLEFCSSRWLENKDNRAKQHGSWCYPWSSVSFPSPQPLPAPSLF